MTKKLPLDTIGGIMQAIQGINDDARKSSGRKKQCPATHGPSRSGTIVFCEYHEGHEGEHKGFRKRWPNTATESERPAKKGEP